jgi:ribonuclease E
MTKRMLIDASHPEETRMVVLDGNRLEEFDCETAGRKPLKGNIYLARVVRVEPSLQAAFVEYGGNRHGFLAFSEIHPDYYQIPVADRQKLLQMQAEEAREAAAEEEAEEAEAEAAEPRRSRRRRRNRRGEARREVAEALASAGTADPAEAAGAPLEAAAEGEAPAAASSTVDAPPAEAAPPMPAEEAPPAAPEAPAAAAVAEAAETSSPPPAAVSAAAPILLPGLAAAEAAGPAAETTPAASAAEPPAQPPAAEIPAAAGQETDAEMPPPATDTAAREDTAGRAIPLALAPEVQAAPSVTAAEDSEEEDEEEDEEDEEEEREDDSSAPEVIGGTTEEEVRERRPPPKFLRNYKIQEVIKRRQIMLVQVVKEERGGKGAALTTYISLAGRFSVLMPNTPRAGGVSRKITSPADRKRLRETIEELGLPEGMSMIIRTAGANRPKAEILRDCEYLLKLWDDIRERTLASTAPCLIYEEADLIKRSIRDVLSRDVEEVWVEGERAFQEAREFTRMLMPSQEKKIRLYNDRSMPLFVRYGVEAQLDAMMSPVVQLKSGGTIVIHQTEALVAIDVNSGRATRDRHIEDTALKVNLEAAEEIARQIRLRDLAGLIVIDFIDMESPKHDALVEKRLKEALKTDRARIQVGRISHFGLLEMSRQRLRPSLTEQAFITCPHCKGLGIVRSPESAALQLLRAIEEEGAKRRAAEILVRAAPPVVMHILNRKRERLAGIERAFGMAVLFEPDAAMLAADFRIERTRGPAPAPAAAETVPALRMDYAAAPAAAPAAEPETEAEAEAVAETATAGETTSEAAAPTAAATAEEATAEDRQPRRRRRRRRRGRREGTESISTGTAAEAAEGEDAEAEEGEASAETAAAEAAPEPPAEAAHETGAQPPGRPRQRGRGRREEPDRPAPPRPTPADPFAGVLDPIYAAMEAMERAAEAALAGTPPAAKGGEATGATPPAPPAAAEAPASSPAAVAPAEPAPAAAAPAEPTAGKEPGAQAAATADAPAAAAPATGNGAGAPPAAPAAPPPAAPAEPVAAPPIQPIPVEQATHVPRRRGWWSR